MIARHDTAFHDPVLHDTVLFDLDGTLIDSVGLILECYGHTARVHLGREIPDEHFLAGLGRPLHVEFAALTDDPVEVEAMVATYRAHNLERHDEAVTAFPGAVEAVSALAARGAQLGIVTSKLGTTARRGLDVCGFDMNFETLIGSTEVRHHKPHPEPIQLALAQLSADPTRTIYVGDSPHDLTAGRAAGVRTAAALWGAFDHDALLRCEPDAVLRDPSELAGL